jgi:predicted nucleic acid-binding Zn ribbon protein
VSARDDPVPLAEALAAIGAELGLPDGTAVSLLSQHWTEVVGAEIAAHARFHTLRDGALVIVVDGALWATELRYLESTIVERASALVGPGVVRVVRVRVGPAN